MKFHAPLIAISLVASLHAAEVPKVFAGLFEQDKPVKAQIGMVVPPKEIDKYVAKVESAARKDPKWFREFSAQAKPGVPLPYDERLGLTKEEYAEYLALWNKREFKPMEEVMLLLRQSAGGTWSITSTGGASTISTLRYVAKDDVFRSPNGDLKRIEDIQADAASILGEWSGMEWKFEEESELAKTKENLAIGRYADNQFGLVVYRVQELSTEGKRILDKSLVVRFALGKAGQVKGTMPFGKAPWAKSQSSEATLANNTPPEWIVVTFRIGKDKKAENPTVKSSTVNATDASHVTQVVLDAVKKTTFRKTKVGAHQTITYGQFIGSFGESFTFSKDMKSGGSDGPVFFTGKNTYKFILAPGAQSPFVSVGKGKSNGQDVEISEGPQGMYKVIGCLTEDTLRAVEATPIR